VERSDKYDFTYNLDIRLCVGCLNQLLNVATFDYHESYTNVSVNATTGGASDGVALTYDHQESERVVDCGASQHAAWKYPRGILQLFSEMN
jgi:hypothetical protein